MPAQNNSSCEVCNRTQWKERNRGLFVCESCKGASYFYFTKFCDYLQSNYAKNEFFDNKKVLQNLINDKKKCAYRTNNSIYFRILNYLIWEKNLKESRYF